MLSNMTYMSDMVVYGETLWGCLRIWMTIARNRVLQETRRIDLELAGSGCTESVHPIIVNGFEMQSMATFWIRFIVKVCMLSTA